MTFCVTLTNLDYSIMLCESTVSLYSFLCNCISVEFQGKYIIYLVPLFLKCSQNRMEIELWYVKARTAIEKFELEHGFDMNITLDIGASRKKKMGAYEVNRLHRELKWNWIFQYKHDEEDVADLITLIESRKNHTVQSTKDFARSMSWVFRDLSEIVHKFTFGKIDDSLIPKDLLERPKRNDALEMFLSFFNFKKPSLQKLAPLTVEN